MADLSDDSRDSAFSLVTTVPAIQGISSYRLIEDGIQPIDPANEFLDMQAARGLSERTLRTYGYGLLNLWRWLSHDALEFENLTEADLLQYIRFQRAEGAAPKTINLHLTIAHSLYRYLMGQEMPMGRRKAEGSRSPLRIGGAADIAHLRPSSRRVGRLRVKAPRRVVVPLTPEEVRDFLRSFRTWRDLSIVGLMLLCGLRSREVISLTMDDVRVSEGELRVRGKGSKERMIPLAPQVISPIQSYLAIERPRTASRTLFVSLKGSKRGKAMTASGLSSLFRYHRRGAGVPAANAHRFRHTFGAAMVRAGMSLPALMKLMGHSMIHHTMVYVELSPEDVREEYERVVRKLRAQTFRLDDQRDA